MRLPEKSRAISLLDDYFSAYKKRDIKEVLSFFTDNATLWGTALDEYRVGLKEIEEQHLRDWSQSEKAQVDIISVVTTKFDAPFASVRCRVTVTIASQTHILEDLRGTIIIEKEAGVWKIAHMHASFPDYRNQEGHSFPKI